MPEHTSENQADQAFARRVCQDCPVRLACHAAAIAVKPTAGTWAGITYGQGPSQAGSGTPRGVCRDCDAPAHSDMALYCAACLARRHHAAKLAHDRRRRCA